MAKKPRGNAKAVWAIAVVGLITGAAAFSAGYVNPSSQLAAGIEADMQCVGDYDPTCQYPQTNPRTGKKCLIGKPCQDVTSGHVTSGTCQALSKCKGEQTGGMMPMLPMLPMPMPKMPMPSMPSAQEPCPTTNTGATTTATTTSEQAWTRSIPCTSSGVSSLSSYIFGSNTETSSSGQRTEQSSWSKLLSSLLGTETETSGDSSGSATEQDAGTGGSWVAGSGLFEGLRRGVQTIVRLTSVTQPPVETPASDTVVSPWRSGYVPSESTFVNTNASGVSTEASVIATIQASLSQLAETLRNFLSSLTK